MTPKIEFRYSWIYDQNWKIWIKKYKGVPRGFPSYKKIINYIKAIKPIWKKEESRTLKELSAISKLKWKVKEIPCYVVGRAFPFSDPLTLPIYKDKDWFVDVLTHELIHQLFTQKGNMEITERSWNYIFKKYKKESDKTKIHIPLHAIHSDIYLKFFGDKRLNEDIRIMQHHIDYKKSWDIVQKEGYKNIINEFTKRIK